MKTHKEIFTEIYDNNVWGGSGGGSSPENTVEYRAFLQKFLKDYDIKTVVDFGCGDWSFSHLIDWSGINYTGYDCVESVIKTNQKKNKFSNIKFTSILPLKSLDYGECLIVKDVLQHWSNEDIDGFLQSYKYFKYILITNTQYNSDRPDINPGECCGLSAKFEPLKKYNPEVLAVIKTTIISEVCLITNL